MARQLLGVTSLLYIFDDMVKYLILCSKNIFITADDQVLRLKERTLIG